MTIVHHISPLGAYLFLIRFRCGFNLGEGFFEGEVFKVFRHMRQKKLIAKTPSFHYIEKLSKSQYRSISESSVSSVVVACSSGGLIREWKGIFKGGNSRIYGNSI